MQKGTKIKRNKENRRILHERMVKKKQEQNFLNEKNQILFYCKPSSYHHERIRMSLWRLLQTARILIPGNVCTLYRFQLAIEQLVTNPKGKSCSGKEMDSREE